MIKKKPVKKLTKTEELTPLEQKRVTILKDAIAQIKAEAYVIKAEIGYVNADQNSNIDNEIDSLRGVCNILEDKSPKEVELKKYIDKLISPKKPCQVCAKGAMLISSIRKFNNVSFEALELASLDDLASRRSQKIFGTANANLMESYFEYTDSEDIEDHYNPSRIKFIKSRNSWLEKYPKDTERLIAIFKNAVKNKGIFKP